jgi:hypothetical protein
MLNERTFALPFKDGDFTVEAGDAWGQGDLFPFFPLYSLIHPPSKRLDGHLFSPLLDSMVEIVYNFCYEVYP